MLLSFELYSLIGILITFSSLNYLKHHPDDDDAKELNLRLSTLPHQVHQWVWMIAIVAAILLWPFSLYKAVEGYFKK